MDEDEIQSKRIPREREREASIAAGIACIPHPVRSAASLADSSLWGLEGGGEKRNARTRMNSLQPSPASGIPPRRDFAGTRGWVRSATRRIARAHSRALAALTALGQMRRASNFFSLSPSVSFSPRATGYVLGRRDPLATSLASARSLATTKLYELNGRYTLAPRNLQFTLPRCAAPSRARVARSLARLREKDAESLSIKAPRLVYAPRREQGSFFK